MIHHEKIISVQTSFKGYVFHFRDSQQLLISSLSKLGKSFNVDIQKSIFPYDFVNENNLDYIGGVPDLKFFDNLNQEDYNIYNNDFYNNNWNLKNETIKYCEIDCISLYQIILNLINWILINLILTFINILL